MVNADSSYQQGSDSLDLGELPVDLVKPLELLFDKFADQTLGVTIGEVHSLVQIFGKLQRSSP
jgi:hypothetical protein